MKKLLLLTAAMLNLLLLQAQGIYQLWGMTPNGGNEDMGVIFKTDGTGKNLRVTHEFKIQNPGAEPYATLAQYNGKFYGTTRSGGKYYAGVIFEWDPATNVYTKKYDFDETNGSGSFGSLVLKDNKFFGMTSGGGSNGCGVIFEWNPATNIYTKKIDLSTSGGSNPRGNLILNAGKFYGMTPGGGNQNAGVIFEWDPVLNIYTKEIDFEQNSGTSPYGDLTVMNGKFYGMTYGGGANDAGVIFEWNPALNIYTKKIDLTLSEGSSPFGNGLTASNGKFYGMTTRGGINDYGVIFEWDPATNIYTKKIDLTLSNGYYPEGNLTASAGKFYGMTVDGGANPGGVIFEWDPSLNIYTKKIDFGSTNGMAPRRNLILSNGKFYGTTSGGGYMSGVIFEWNPETNLYIKKIDFNLNNGTNPYGGLTFHDRKLYGMTQVGGANGEGVIFEWNPVTNVYTKKIDFLVGLIGGYPTGSLTFSGSKFYGMTWAVDGTIFEWDPLSNICIKKETFVVRNGSTPYGNLTESNGILYGMTSDGGSGWDYDPNVNGVIFRLDPNQNQYQILETFTGPNGRFPMGSLTLNGGKFYGMTSGGGANGSGVIFEYDPSTYPAFTKKYDFGNTSGSPYGTMSAYQGKLYGVAGGGANQHGLIFEWNPVSDIYTEKFNFDSVNGGAGNFILNNGKFYGMSNGIFEWDPVTNVYTKTTDFSGTNLVGGNDLAVTPAPVAEGLPGSCKTFPSVTIDNTNNNQWVSITDEENNAVAEIKANGNNLGVVTASVFINNGKVREDGTGRLYLDRSITLTSQYPQKSAVDIRLYIKGSEYTALKNAHNSFGQSAGINSINDVGIFKIKGGCAPAAANISNLISTSGAAWENDYVLSASINSFTSFYFACKNPCAAPVISAVSASTSALSPADHQMKNVTINYSAKGNCFPITTWLTVTSNEPVSGTGNGDLSPDWIIIDEHHLQLRSERSVSGTGRTYTITVNAKNAFGTYCKKTIKVVVTALPVTLAKTADGNIENGLFDCKVVPNPTSNYFNLQIQSASSKKIEVSLTDISGRLISKWTTAKGETNRFGENLKPGVYTVNVIQGQKQQMLKIIKQ